MVERAPADHGRPLLLLACQLETCILGTDEAMKAALGKLHMHGKLIEPEKVASVVAFLFTDAAQAINGSTIPVDDGFLQFKA